MKISQLDKYIFISDQIVDSDLQDIAKRNIKTIICHRPDDEGADQPDFEEIAKQAKKLNIECHYIPVVSGKISDEDVKNFSKTYAEAPKPVLSYCRSGMRAASMWALSQADTLGVTNVLNAGKNAGFDLSGLTSRMAKDHPVTPPNIVHHEIVIVGGGAAGIAVASSLLSRNSGLDVVIIDPANAHYYQPGWTMVGGGIFKPSTTVKTMASVIPSKAKWIKAAVAAFEPESKQVILEGCRVVSYDVLVVCPGLKLNWHGIEGLVDTLGQNGVTSNYRYDLAPYTWELVRKFKKGRAIFTQPPMPIKCAGAPQKALYLSADHWLKNGNLKDIQIDFYNAGAVLFGVKEYVPALMEYIERYKVQLHFNSKLTKIDGLSKTAWFTVTDRDGKTSTTETKFDMIHVVPPQQAPDFIRASKLADAGGWVDVNQDTLEHKVYPNIYALGDVINCPNAKTAAAARKQAPVAATNILFYLNKGSKRAAYDGYGSCPLTVERGKIVLAEFGYGGRLLPSFPKWFIDGQRPSRLAWIFKERLLPPIYWWAMLKGREWMAKPIDLDSKK
ncbi:MAG: TIGR01244 family phosphatase [Nitrosomonadales bacterium]|nr:TIGR01244 family phosphatase [Nitrosomonadales bacterium]